MSMKLSAEMFGQILSTLKSDTALPEKKEKRSEGRVGLRCTLQIVQYPPAATVGNKPLEVSVHDISVGGVGLVSATKLEPGTEFIACFCRDGKSPVPVLYKVMHCRKMSSDLFTVGAMLTRVLPDRTGEVAFQARAEKAGKGKACPEKPQVPATASAA